MREFVAGPAPCPDNWGMARHEQPPARRRLSAVLATVAVVWTSIWGVLTVAVLFPTVIGLLTGAPDATDGLYAFAFFGACTGVGAVLCRVARRAEPAPEPRPVIRPHPRLPSSTSVARQPMKQLDEAETALAQLIDRMRDTAVPSAVVEDAWRTATSTAAELRAVATTLESVELAARHAPTSERPALEAGVGTLRTRLEQGLEDYRGLVAVAGRVLLASAPALAKDELIDATEGLVAVADGLRELSAWRRPEP